MRVDGIYLLFLLLFFLFGVSLGLGMDCKINSSCRSIIDPPLAYIMYLECYVILQH